MPSPFPGMDPYLEGSQWTSVHAELSVEIARQLAPRLPPRYVARTNERFVIIVPEPEHGTGARTTAIYPDAFVADTGTSGPAGASGANGGGLAIASPPLSVATVMPESLRLLTVEIRDAAEMRLVTAIELLSPANKRGEGRTEYLMKRQRVLLGAAHLMEIDLLRSGHRLPMRDPLPGHPYFVFLSRAEKRPQTDVWPIGLGAPLPTVPVPLLPGDADVPLNLQEALGSVYDTFRYDRTINYALPPDVPLAPQEAAWADERLRRWRAAGTGR
jgi:hypothetical protein